MADSYKQKIKLYQLLNVIGFIITIVVNTLANALPLNGKTTGEISDFYPNLFAPAGLTFAIWGVIYLALGLFVVYQLGFFSRGNKEYLDVVSRIGYAFFIGSMANSGWIFAWHYEKILISLVIMLILLVTLINIYQTINKNKAGSIIEETIVRWPFSIYLSWISVATIANITTFLVSINWDGLGIPEAIWTIVVILVATIITLRFVFYKRDIPYALVTVWAFMGILIKHVTFFGGAYKGIIIMTAFCILIIVASLFAMPKAFQMQRS